LKKKNVFFKKIQETVKKWHPDYVPAQDLTEPVPEAGWKRYVFLLRNHFVKLLCCSSVYLLTCIPVVTIPAATAGLCHVMMELERKGNVVSWWNAYFVGFRDRFFDRLLLGLGSVSIPCCMAILLLSLQVKETVALCIAFGIYLLCNSVWQYFLVLQDVMDLKLGQNLRNAVLLALTNLKTTLVLVVCALVFTGIILYLFPYWVIPFAFFGFAAKQLLFCSLIWPIAKQRLVVEENV